MKTYIQPATQITQVQLHAIICLSIDKSGEKATGEGGYLNSDAPMRKLTTLYI